MKTLFTFLIISALFTSCMPTVQLFERDSKLMGILPLVNGRVVYQEKVQTAEIPKEEVFRRARRWWVNNYKSVKDVFQLVDKETGEIIGKGYGRIYVSEKGLSAGPHNVYHVISFDVRDDDYTVTVYGLQIESAFTKALNPKNPVTTEIPIERYNIGTIKSVSALFREVDQQTRLTLKSLQDYIKKPTI